MKKNNCGFYIALYGNVLILLWIGIFKFTNAEAKGIQDLVTNSPFMNWMYSLFSVQGVSNFFGTFEIITAIMLASFPFSKNIAFIGAILNTTIYLSTLSFLFTTPGVWKIVENVPTTNFFILKDIMALGIGIMVIIETYAFFRKSLTKSK